MSFKLIGGCHGNANYVARHSCIGNCTDCFFHRARRAARRVVIAPIFILDIRDFSCVLDLLFCIFVAGNRIVDYGYGNQEEEDYN